VSKSNAIVLSLAASTLLALAPLPHGTSLAAAAVEILFEPFDGASGLEDTIFSSEAEGGAPPAGAELTQGPDKALELSSDGEGGEVALYADALTGAEDGTWLLSFELTLQQAGAAFLCCPDQSGQHGFHRIMGVAGTGRVSLADQETDVVLAPGTRVQLLANMERTGTTLTATVMLMDPVSWTTLATKQGVNQVPDTWFHQFGVTLSRASAGRVTLDNFHLWRL
jgi:hypothetical protein